MNPLLFCLDGNLALQTGLAAAARLQPAACQLRQFPDEESYVRVLSDVQGRDAVILCSLHGPDKRFIPLCFLMETLREMGTRSVGLVAPYLAYMRQDQRFHPGEAVSARLFAALLAPHIDWLVTVDPHLHRIHDLGTLYPVPHRVVHAAPALAAWIPGKIARPLLIGPDSESEQWVSEVARLAKAPFIVLQKMRLGDREVAVSVPDIQRWREHTPVLIDDIISTGHTLLETAGHLQRAGMRPPVALAVHGVYAEHAQRDLQAAGIQVFTSNSIRHASNAIDLSTLLAQAIKELAP
ncbi:phosphoribosylpyrophosphate synthetase [Pseudomonas frederiksbergensis]|uniref:Phosphoribosylpyrophosphate synthetase n=2 Tax=Pseudomonas TaxID=286 RepID=A0A2S8HD38_9PSED|nr:ribose-phosphate pyrophosphokinase [Pseudomonas frederiksbergensis]PQP00431.1 phosphoribosylpyrophosphate synthetase [Pseudomonas frederiksbergensis]